MKLVVIKVIEWGIDRVIMMIVVGLNRIVEWIIGESKGVGDFDS